MTDYYLHDNEHFRSKSPSQQWYWVLAPAASESAHDNWKSITQGHELQWQDVKGDRYFAPPGMIYRHLFVGVGSSIAYYLNAMGEDFDHKQTLIFGSVDAWTQEVRGDGFINHEEHQVSQWSKTVPKYSDKYMERSVFVAQNRSIFQNAMKKGARFVNNEIKSISLRGEAVQVMDTQGDTWLAARVVVGSGAGPHYSFEEGRGPVLDRKFTSPPERAKQKDLLMGKVINLDEFMRLHPRTAKMNGPLEHEKEREDLIIVHGPNAGIDAVHRAWQYGYKILWLSGNTDPVLLKGNRLGLKSVLETDRITFQKIGREAPEVEADGDGVRVKYTYKNAQESVQVAYYVIALGQNPFGKGAVGDLLQQGNIQWNELEPIYDVNQIFGLPYQTVLGFQSKHACHGRGLQIIGAAADALARDAKVEIEHTYAQQFGLAATKDPKLVARRKAADQYLSSMSMADLMDHQVDPGKVPKDLTPPIAEVRNGLTVDNEEFARSLVSTKDAPAATNVASVVLNAQLGGVRAAAAALNGFIPQYIKRNANLTTDDRTMLAVYIAQNYPYIPSKELEEEVAKIIQERRSDARPLGYTELESSALKARLSALNARRCYEARSKKAS